MPVVVAAVAIALFFALRLLWETASLCSEFQSLKERPSPTGKTFPHR